MTSVTDDLMILSNFNFSRMKRASEINGRMSSKKSRIHVEDGSVENVARAVAENIKDSSEAVNPLMISSNDNTCIDESEFG